MQHILSEAHKIRIRQNPYNDHIIELISSCELEHRIEPEDSEQTDIEPKLSHTDLLASKPKKLRKAEKLAAKDMAIQHHTSVFTEVYTRQLARNGNGEDDKTVNDGGIRSFRVEDYLAL
jgi:hypothetical protein